MHEPNTRKVRRWLQDAGALIRRPGVTRQLVMPLAKFQELFPELWDHYCALNEVWDAPAACKHPQPDRYVDMWWCDVCGGVTHDRGKTWKLPTLPRPSSRAPDDA